MSAKALAALAVGLSLSGCPAPAAPDGGPACRAATALCGSTCADLRLDDSHCGACGRACPDEEACGNGECLPRVCPDFDCTSSYVCLTARCAERACVGAICPAGESCLQGVCLPTQCVGMSCPPQSVCRSGSCIDVSCLGVLCPQSQYCEGGVCRVPCAAGELCATGDPCRSGVTTCDGGTSSCQPGAPLDAGAACGSGVCDGDGGCGGCNAGAACAPGAPCAWGTIACDTGGPVCVSAGLVDAGTPCDAGLCSAAGQCVAGCADPYWGQVMLLMHFDDRPMQWLTDSSRRQHVFSSSSATVSTVQSRFGGASARFGGNAYLSTPDSSDFTLGQGDFTVEAWVFRTGSSPNANTIVAQYPSSMSSNKAFTLEASTYFRVGMRYTLGGLVHTDVSGSAVVPANMWRHVAITRAGGVIRVFVDGAQTGSGSETAALFDSTAPLTIGGTTVAGHTWVGHIDELRFTRGVARYTAPFMPPAGPFPTCP